MHAPLSLFSAIFLLYMSTIDARVCNRWWVHISIAVVGNNEKIRDTRYMIIMHNKMWSSLIMNYMKNFVWLLSLVLIIRAFDEKRWSDLLTGFSGRKCQHFFYFFFLKWKWKLTNEWAKESEWFFYCLWTQQLMTFPCAFHVV